MKLAKAKGNIESINNYDYTWTDIQKPTRDHVNLLGEQYTFHELNLDDCLSKVHIPKIDKYKDHLFIILNFPVNVQEDIPKASQLSIFVGANYLVTIHQSEIKPLVEMFQRCKSNNKERETLMGNSPGFLLHSILETVVEDLFHRLTKIEGNLDDLEDEIFDERTKSARAKEINLLRREIASLRRIIIPLRNRIFEITHEIHKFSKEDLTSYYNDVEDHVNKIMETLDGSKRNNRDLQGCLLYAWNRKGE